MTTDYTGTLTLSSVDVTTLTAAVAGYLVSFTEAGGATAPSPVAVALNATTFDIALGVGTWTASVVAVDGTGAALTAAVTSNAVVVTAPAIVTVEVPASVTLTLKA